MNTDLSPDMPTVALIAGPTASGKSALALQLAEATGGTVVNADASQVYRDLPILSARPSAADEARVPHRLYGHVDAAIAHSAADWAAEARGVIDELHGQGRLPILVGGTGLYLRTLLDGIAPVPPIDPAVREGVRALPVAAAYAALGGEDPAAAARLHPHDTTRIARALEVVRSTGRPLGDWQAERTGGIGGRVRVAALVLAPPRPWLHARAAKRFDAMLAAGALDEVRALAARKLDPALPAMRAIGVRELLGVVASTSTLAEAASAAITATRQYVKRQSTWFAHQADATWHRAAEPFDDTEAIQSAIMLLTKPLTR